MLSKEKSIDELGDWTNKISIFVCIVHRHLE